MKLPLARLSDVTSEPSVQNEEGGNRIATLRADAETLRQMALADGGTTTPAAFIAANVDAAGDAITAAQDRIRVLERALSEARGTIVLSVAFLGRDLGSLREKTTVQQLIAKLVAAEKNISAALMSTSSPAANANLAAVRETLKREGGTTP